MSYFTSTYGQLGIEGQESWRLDSNRWIALPKMKLEYLKHFRWTLSTCKDQYAVYGSQISQPYSKMGLTNAQYKVFTVSIWENFLVGLITNPRVFNALHYVISI